jgi:two-component system, sensor histidine kinase
MSAISRPRDEIDPPAASLQSVAAALPLAVCIIASDDTVLAWNPAAEALFHLPAAVVLGRPFRDLESTLRLDGLLAAVESVKHGDPPVRLHEVRLSHPGGDTTITVFVEPVDGRGHPAAVLVSAEDRSEIAVLTAQLTVVAEELQSANMELETTNEELQSANEQLLAANEELEEKFSELQGAYQASRHKDDFLAMLAHELRNPLAPILSAMHVLKLHPEDSSLVQRVREVVERQVRHQARLLDDLLDVSRITRGKIELRTVRTDLAAVVADAVETTRTLIEARRHSIAVHLPEQPVCLDADPTRLGQVLANLLSNAAKYTEPGGRITVSVAAEDGEAVMRVRDTGHGIPAEMQPHVFDLFTQVEPSLARSQGGLGIGLTLVRSLVEMHGGRVEVSSEGPGKGSEFTVRLPMQAPVEEVAPSSSHPRPTPSRHILVVEDNPDAREMLRVSLELEGHRVEAAEDGLRGVETALLSRPEVALVDIGLPGLNGYEVATRLRAALGRSIALIALTGYGQPEDRERTRRAGFDAHLVKPVDPDTLTRLLAEDFKAVRS